MSQGPENWNYDFRLKFKDMDLSELMAFIGNSERIVTQYKERRVYVLYAQDEVVNRNVATVNERPKPLYYATPGAKIRTVYQLGGGGDEIEYFQSILADFDEERGQIDSPLSQLAVDGVLNGDGDLARDRILFLEWMET